MDPSIGQIGGLGGLQGCVMGVDVFDTAVGLGHQLLSCDQAGALDLALFDHLKCVHGLVLSCPGARCTPWIDCGCSNCYNSTYPKGTMKKAPFWTMLNNP